MTATASPKYKSREEILAAGLSAFHTSELLKELNRWEQEHPTPPAPRPVPDAGQRAQLENLKHSFSTEEKSLVEIEADRKLFAEILQTTTAGNTRPDAPTEDVIAAIVAEWRVQKMRIFIANAIPKRQEIERRLMALFHQFNGIASKLGSREQYLSGSTPETCCGDAIAAIDRLLATNK